LILLAWKTTQNVVPGLRIVNSPVFGVHVTCRSLGKTNLATSFLRNRSVPCQHRSWFKRFGRLFVTLGCPDRIANAVHSNREPDKRICWVTGRAK